jgi:hypothetical protein
MTGEIQEGGKLAFKALLGADLKFQQGEKLLCLLRHGFQEQVFLAREVIVDRGFPDLGAARDIVHGGFGETEVGKQLGRGAQDHRSLVVGLIHVFYLFLFLNSLFRVGLAGLYPNIRPISSNRSKQSRIFFSFCSPVSPCFKALIKS